MNKKRLFEQILNDSFDILDLQNKFVELSGIFQELCIPHLLTTTNDDGQEKLHEAEKVELEDKYEQFKLKIKQFTRLTQSFLIKSNAQILIDHNFLNHIDTEIYESVNIFEKLNKINEQQIEKIQNAYSAFIMLARILNTGIKQFNDSHPNNTIGQLHNIPDPQFYNIQDLNQFYKQFVLTLNKYLS